MRKALLKDRGLRLRLKRESVQTGKQERWVML